MVQSRVTLAQGASLQTFFPGSTHNFIPQRPVVLYLNAHLGGAKGRHIARSTRSRGNVKIISVQNRVW